jgi:cyclophilin family peptidyl-prolyl cis-trans isomerase/HEAT repeat protein
VRSAARLAALAALGAAAWVAPLAAQDQGQVNDLAQLLSLEDRREFDGAALRRAALHPDALIRSQAAVALGRIVDRAGVPLLLTLLADQDTTVRTEAAFALGALRDTSALDELVHRLDAFPAVATGADQLEIVTALARIGGPVAARALDALWQRHPPGGATDDAATAASLQEAWRLGRFVPAARLVEYVGTSSGAWRRNATYSAGRLRLAAAGVALLDAATDPDDLTRAYAARALTAALADSARIARAAFVARLRPLVGDTNAQVRIGALRSLATFRDSSLASLAQSRLGDRDPNAVVQAAATLGSLGGSGAIASLEERFKGAGGGGAGGGAGTSFAVRRSALLALAQAAPARAVELGRSWRSDADWRLRAAVAEALGIVPPDLSRAALEELSADPDARVAETALAALGGVTPKGDAALRALARSRLTHADVMVRTAAIDLLDRERDPSLLPDLVGAYRAAEREEANDARLAAVRALGDIADVDAAAASRVEMEFLSGTPRSADYLVRRAVADRFGDEVERQYWGNVYPIETGRSGADYRDLASRILLPALQGGALPQVTIETDHGSLVLLLYAADAPLTVQNFLRLVDRRFFDGSRWHRVVPNFVIQDGDPRGDGNGGPGWVIRDEINRRRYDRGAVGMALSGPDTGGSQFFITHSPQPHLDGGYTVFGHLVQGDDVLDQIVQGDRIRRIIR